MVVQRDIVPVGEDPVEQIRIGFRKWLTGCTGRAHRFPGPCSRGIGISQGIVNKRGSPPQRARCDGRGDFESGGSSEQGPDQYARD